MPTWDDLKASVDLLAPTLDQQFSTYVLQSFEGYISDILNVRYLHYDF